MNKVILIGRLTRDVESVKSSVGTPIAKFTLAVDTHVKGITNFINCVAFNQTAELLTQLASKGRLVAVDGTLEQNVYTREDGSKVTTYSVYVNDFKLLDKKPEEKAEEPKSKAKKGN